MLFFLPLLTGSQFVGDNYCVLYTKLHTLVERSFRESAVDKWGIDTEELYPSFPPVCSLFLST
jgi:hypothetical protein